MISNYYSSDTEMEEFLIIEDPLDHASDESDSPEDAIPERFTDDVLEMSLQEWMDQGLEAQLEYLGHRMEQELINIIIQHRSNAESPAVDSEGDTRWWVGVMDYAGAPPA